MDAFTSRIHPLVVVVGAPFGVTRGRLVAEVWGVGAEKSFAVTRCASVLKLTQVGEESILRRSRELFLRN